MSLNLLRTVSHSRHVWRKKVTSLSNMIAASNDNPDRVIYARKAEEYSQTIGNAGEPIDVETASALKDMLWGSSNMPLKHEWSHQGLVLHLPEHLFAYGLRLPKNGTKNFLTCVQAYFLKYLLFERKSKSSSQQKRFRRYNAVAERSDGANSSLSEFIKTWSQVLRPTDRIQQEMVVGGITDLLGKVRDGKEAIVCIPGQLNCFEANASYGIDGITEKLRIFRCTTEEQIKSVVKKFIFIFTQENGCGLLCLIYSLLLTRNFSRLKEDMHNKQEDALIDALGDCSPLLMNLVITGTATPYLHNGIIEIEAESEESGCNEEELDDDREEEKENKPAAKVSNKPLKMKELVGITGRNDIGLLIWEYDEDKTSSFSLGSRLKTPVLPIWLVRCNESMGLLFNPNKELMKSYHAEHRFQLYYYSDVSFKKDEKPQETILTIDNRGRSTNAPLHLTEGDDEQELKPLEQAIKTKWPDAAINWNGIAPYV